MSASSIAGHSIRFNTARSKNPMSRELKLGTRPRRNPRRRMGVDDGRRLHPLVVARVERIRLNCLTRPEYASIIERHEPTAASLFIATSCRESPRTPTVKDEATMTLIDNGPHPNAFDIEKATLDNENYRAVAWTGRHLQVTLMTIPVGESIGLEAHPDTDQFLRLEAGRGKVVMGPAKDQLDFEHEVGDGSSVQVPAGMWHDIINVGDEPMRLYAIYAPSHHAAGAVQATSAAAAHEEHAGEDDAPPWTEQPSDGKADKHS
jgi:mannose-6-phosphate isomerase-like protein (cupin superfamily)